MIVCKPCSAPPPTNLKLVSAALVSLVFAYLLWVLRFLTVTILFEASEGEVWSYILYIVNGGLFQLVQLLLCLWEL